MGLSAAAGLLVAISTSVVKLETGCCLFNSSKFYFRMISICITYIKITVKYTINSTGTLGHNFLKLACTISWLIEVNVGSGCKEYKPIQYGYIQYGYMRGRSCTGTGTILHS